MLLTRVTILLGALCAAPGAVPARSGETEWAKGVAYTTDWEHAIRLSQETGRPLFVYTGYQEEGRCHVSDAARRAIGTLAAGEQKSSARYRRKLREEFVLLSDFIRSEQEEGQTHGPEAEEFEKFRIEIVYTPVLTFKSSEGETLATRVGLSLKPREAIDELRELVDRALKQNGPVRAPGKTRALVRVLDAGRKAREAGRIAAAISAYLKLVEMGGDARKFPDRMPALAVEAQSALGLLEREAIRELDELQELGVDDPAAARQRYLLLSRKFGQLEKIQARITEALEGL